MGAVHPRVQELAKLGASGRHPNNCHRELVAKLGPSAMLAAMDKIKLYFKKPFTTVVAKVEHHILLPHKVFATLYEVNREAFVARLLGGKHSNIKSFWEAMDGHPAYRNHPVASRTDHMSHCIPLSLHGDGVAVSGVSRSWSKSVDAYSWMSLLSSGSTKLTNFMIYFYYPKLVVDVAGMSAHDALFKK